MGWSRPHRLHRYLGRSGKVGIVPNLEGRYPDRAVSIHMRHFIAHTEPDISSSVRLVSIRDVLATGPLSALPCVVQADSVMVPTGLVIFVESLVPARGALRLFLRPYRLAESFAGGARLRSRAERMRLCS